MRFRLLSILGAIGIIAASPAAGAGFSTQAEPGDTFTATAGGAGGSPYVLRCDQGSYLMGIGVRKGAWIDYAEPYCGWVNWDGALFLREIGGGQFTGDGAGNIGQPNGASARCSDLEFIVFGLFPTQVVTGEGNVFLGTFGVACRRMAPSGFEQEAPSYHHDIHIDYGQAAYVPLGAITCGDNEWAVGIHGGAGLYVDRMGLICAAAMVPANLPQEDDVILDPDIIVQDPPGDVILAPPEDDGIFDDMLDPDVIIQPQPDDGILDDMLDPDLIVASETFYQPMLEGYPVDICYTWAEQCGRPAADAFCAAVGYTSAEAFEYEYDRPPTRVIGTGEICEFDYCTRFGTITCQR